MTRHLGGYNLRHYSFSMTHVYNVISYWCVQHRGFDKRFCANGPKEKFKDSYIFKIFLPNRNKLLQSRLIMSWRKKFNAKHFGN